MQRDLIPEYAMHGTGPEHLRKRGIQTMRFMDSVRDDPRRLKPHFHEFFQMYLLQGDAMVMLDFQEFRAEGATTVFISPGQVHTVRPETGLQGWTVSFTQAFHDHETPPPSALLELPLFLPDDAPPWLRVPLSHQPEIAPLFHELCEEYERGLPDAEALMRATLRLLLLRLGRLHAREAPARGRPNRGQALMRGFYLDLEKYFRTETEVGGYALRLGVTANHLNDVVREQAGHSAGELIRRRRMLDAKRLLSHSDLSVSEIGYTLGFEDPSYFARFFRRHEGVAPSVFRDEIREKYQ